MQGPNGRRENRKGPPPPLDEPVRQKMAKFSGVAEVYPDIRFPAELRLNSASSAQVLPAVRDESTKAKAPVDNPPQTGDTGNSREYQLISGLPMSARQLETFDSMKGKYFSAP